MDLYIRCIAVKIDKEREVVPISFSVMGNNPILKTKTPLSRNTKYFLFAGLFISIFITYSYNAHHRRIFFGNILNTFYENENLKIEQIGSIPRLAISYNIDGDLYATEDHYVLKKMRNRNFFIELGHFNRFSPNIAERLKDFFLRLRIIRDLRKNIGANNCISLKSGAILNIYDKIYRSVDQGASFHPVFDFSENAIQQPFEHGIAVDQYDDIYFGEYDCRPGPHNIRIMKGSNNGSVWSIFHEFSLGEIRHVHSIKYDIYRDILWVCCGDSNDQSKIMFIDKNRKKLELLGSGDQGWRIVSLITTKDSLFWCSDNDITGSNIYRYSFANNQRELVASVGKPSYYSTQLRDCTLVISTCFEPASQYSKLFNPERSTDLWISKNGKDWYKVLSVPGKIYETASGLSRPNLILPGGDYSAEYIFLTQTSTLDSDFSTRVLKVTWKR